MSLMFCTTRVTKGNEDHVVVVSLHNNFVCVKQFSNSGVEGFDSQGNPSTSCFQG